MQLIDSEFIFEGFKFFRKFVKYRSCKNHPLCGMTVTSVSAGECTCEDHTALAVGRVDHDSRIIRTETEINIRSLFHRLH